MAEAVATVGSGFNFLPPLAVLGVIAAIKVEPRGGEQVSLLLCGGGAVEVVVDPGDACSHGEGSKGSIPRTVTAASRIQMTVCALLAAAFCLASCNGVEGTADGPAAPPSDQVALLEPAPGENPASDASKGRFVETTKGAPEEAGALADGTYPPDFTLDVTVLVGLGAPELLKVEERQAKYVLLPDGALHSDASPFIDISTRPGRTRWLYEDQVQFVWALCDQLGFTDERNANGPPNPDMLQVPRGERLAVMTLRASGRTWTFVRRATDAQPFDAAAVRIVRTLAILSWLPDYRPEDIAPERYDFGPDPYAVYRAIRAQQPSTIRR